MKDQTFDNFLITKPAFPRNFASLSSRWVICCRLGRHQKMFMTFGASEDIKDEPATAWNISITFLLRWFLAAALIKSIIYNWNPIKFVFHGASLYQWVFFVRKLKPHVARIPLFPSRPPSLMAEARWPKHEIFVRCLLPALVFCFSCVCWWIPSA